MRDAREALRRIVTDGLPTRIRAQEGNQHKKRTEENNPQDEDKKKGAEEYKERERMVGWLSFMRSEDK